MRRVFPTWSLKFPPLAAVACVSYVILGTVFAEDKTDNKASKTGVSFDTKPPRGNPDLALDRAGWSYDCMECHRSIESKWKRDHDLAEHKHIKLDHGNNRFCLNCHHPENRNAFVDYDGSEISGRDTVALCAKCHGTLHQDWEAGAHGRRNGFWDTSKGEQTRLSCSQCHDPHAPAIEQVAPLPGPKYPERAAGKKPSTKEESHKH